MTIKVTTKQYRKMLLTPGMRMRKMNKFNARRVMVDRIWFDSQGEANHYKRLKLLQQAGKIKDLQVHPVFPLVINGKSVGRVKPDYVFWDVEQQRRRYQDFKSPVTQRLSGFRFKVFEALYNIEVEFIQRDNKVFIPFHGYVDADSAEAKNKVRVRKEASRRARTKGLAVIRERRNKTNAIERSEDSPPDQHGEGRGEQ